MRRGVRPRAVTRSVRSRSPARPTICGQDVSDHLVCPSLTQCTDDSPRIPAWKRISAYAKEESPLARRRLPGDPVTHRGIGIRRPQWYSRPGDLAGTGSDTTQGVMNSLSRTTSRSPRALGPRKSGPTTLLPHRARRSPPKSTAPCTNIPRPSGSDAGIQALAADRVAGNHCLQFARSSTDNHTAHVGDHLTYIPFATDAVAYATLDTSNIPRNLTVAQLPADLQLHRHDWFHAVAAAVQLGDPEVLPENILGFTDSADYTTLHPCVSDKDPTNPANPLLENTGNKLTTTTQIEPYSASSWIAQTSEERDGRPRRAVLGNIGGIQHAHPELVCDGDSPGVQRSSQRAGR